MKHECSGNAKIMVLEITTWHNSDTGSTS